MRTKKYLAGTGRGQLPEQEEEEEEERGG